MSDLIISGVEAGYGHVRVLHGVNLKVSDKPVALMGRNGMGKSTLAQVIMGLNATTAGTITYGGVTLTGLSPTKIANAGIGYVPQGRRVFPSLTVDEHLRILEKRNSQWTAKKVYELFPRLAERKKNGGAMLSGGEQQMLAIGRALMTNPTLLLMDEPSEGLAPAIVEHLGNSSHSEEEVAKVLELAAELAGRVGEEEVLIVAPYNAQVDSIRDALDAAGFNQVQVGTVDKFQGQEAPVVFVSMVTSSSEDLPRGIEFLLSPNRLNVAISRAQWACFILRSPHLAIMEPTSPEGMVMLGKFVTLCKN